MAASAHDLALELEWRARSVVAESSRIIRRSHALVAARELLVEDGAMLTRCAWCGRYELGDEWLEPAERPRFLRPDALPDRTTHGICGDCFHRLEANGWQEPSA